MKTTLPLFSLAIAVFISLSSAAQLPDIYNPYTSNPLDQAHGFNIITKKEFKAKGGQVQGPGAFGGDLELSGTSTIANSQTGYFPTSRKNDDANYALVVAGKVKLKGGSTTINKGYVRLDIDTAALIFDKDCNGAAMNLKVKPKATTCNISLSSSQGLQLQKQQSASSAVSASGLDFSAAYTWFNQLSQAISYYGAFTIPITEVVKLSMPATANPHITLVPNKINFIQMTVTQLTTLTTQGTLTFNNSPSSNTPVVFNITVPGNYTWTPPAVAGLADSANHFIVWHMASATGGAHSLTIAGSNRVAGTIFAPNADLTKNTASSVDGQLIVASAEMTAGQLNYYPFLGKMEAFAPTPLPVKLLSFKGTVTNNKANLSWNVAENEVIAYFDVEKSNDGRTFTSIEQSTSTGKTGNESYVATDALGSFGYYRLRIVSLNGNVTYSATIKLQAVTTHSFQTELLQNPIITAALPLRLATDEAGIATINLYTLTGARLFSRNITVQKGSTSLTLPLDQDLSRGTYLLEVVSNGERSLIKMMR